MFQGLLPRCSNALGVGHCQCEGCSGNLGWDSVLLVQICGLLCSNSSDPGGPISEQSHADDPTLP